MLIVLSVGQKGRSKLQDIVQCTVLVGLVVGNLLYDLVAQCRYSLEFSV